MIPSLWGPASGAPLERTFATHMVGTFKLLFNALYWSSMGE